MSQQALAAVVGVTDVCVSLWERAQRKPSPESWVQLELTLGPLGVVREADPRPEAEAGREQAA
jgi:ribosome-binding protein aMBF1 (putative translation factor)